MSRAPRSTTARRDWGTDDAGCHVLHVDMDAFFASVEVRDDPSLAGKAVIVGGRERGVVTAATYEARAYGVRSAMPMSRARALCPHAIVVRPRIDVYRAVSREVMGVLGEITPVLEKVSVDEAFLDVAGAVRRLGSPAAIGHALRAAVRERVGVTASVGVAGTKTVAKLASTHAKPDGLLLIPLAATVPFLRELPVGALSGVGERTEERLARRGIETVADLADTPVAALEKAIGAAHARHLHALAHGVDPRPVRPGREEKSVGTETTFHTDVTDRRELDRVLLRQAHETAARLRADGLLAAGVALKLRHADFTTVTRSRTLGAPSFLAKDLYDAARALLDGLRLPPGGVRLIGVRAERLTAAGSTGVQVQLGEDDGRERVERAVDGVVRRYGAAAVGPAALLDTRVARRTGSPLPPGASSPYP